MSTSQRKKEETTINKKNDQKVQKSDKINE